MKAIKKIVLSVALCSIISVTAGFAQTASDSVNTKLKEEKLIEAQRADDNARAAKRNKEIKKAEKKVDDKAEEVKQAQDKADLKEEKLRKAQSKTDAKTDELRKSQNKTDDKAEDLRKANEKKQEKEYDKKKAEKKLEHKLVEMKKDSIRDKKNSDENLAKPK